MGSEEARPGGQTGGEEKSSGRNAEFHISNEPVTRVEAIEHLLQANVSLVSSFLEGEVTLHEFQKHAEFHAATAALMDIVVVIPTTEGVMSTRNICRGCVYERYCQLYTELLGPMPIDSPRVPHSH